MHLKVQKAVGAEGHNVSTSFPSWFWLDAAHDAKSCWCEGGSLKFQNTGKTLDLWGMSTFKKKKSRRKNQEEVGDFLTLMWISNSDSPTLS